MKKIILLVVYVMICETAHSQEMAGLYEFPVRPGTKAWKEAKTHDELRELGQIPAKVIQQMDTPTLVMSVIRYPLIGDILVFGTFSEGTGQL